MIQIKVEMLTLGEIKDTRLKSNSLVVCKCECGKEKLIRWHDIQRGHCTSCGCKRHKPFNKTHGQSGTKTYTTWKGMRQRCNNPNCEAFPDYGGRGIKVCPRWDSFEAFLKDVGEIPKGMEIDRINNDGNYEPGNVRIVKRKVNINNTSRNRYLEIDGQTKTLAEWCEQFGIKYMIAFDRLASGWDAKKALTEPVAHRRKRK